MTQDIRCGATTRRGWPCRRRREVDSHFCHTHAWRPLQALSEGLIAGDEVILADPPLAIEPALEFLWEIYGDERDPLEGLRRLAVRGARSKRSPLYVRRGWAWVLAEVGRRTAELQVLQEQRPSAGTAGGV